MPDYDRPTAQVYKDLAVGEIEVMHRLNVLWHCDAAAWDHQLPSWVPQWTTPLPYQNLNLGIFGGGRGALGSEDSFGSISEDVLKVNGIVCGIVESCSTMVPSSANQSHMASVIRSWQRTVSLAFDEETLVALCHVITVGYIGRRYPIAQGPASLPAALEIVSSMVTFTGPTRVTDDDRATVFMHMHDALPNRKLFVTTSGHIGLGPSKAERDDIVVSIIGSQRLMLLRATPEGNYRIVGICYLYGFMELQAILGPLPKGCSVELVGSCNDPWDMRFIRDNGEPSAQDPRLERSHEGWNSNRRTPDGGIIWDHIATGHATSSDPRHTDIGFLRRKGITIKEISII